VNAM